MCTTNVTQLPPSICRVSALRRSSSGVHARPSCTRVPLSSSLAGQWRRVRPWRETLLEWSIRDQQANTFASDSSRRCGRRKVQNTTRWYRNQVQRTGSGAPVEFRTTSRLRRSYSLDMNSRRVAWVCSLLVGCAGASPDARRVSDVAVTHSPYTAAASAPTTSDLGSSHTAPAQPRGKRAPCVFGQDQTCNGNPSVSALWGKCTESGTCQCHEGFALAPSGYCQPK